MKPDVTFRPARLEDLEALVPLIHASGPAAFDYVFSHASRGDALQYLRHAFADGRGQFGYRNHIVAELGGKAVGVGAGYGGETALSFLIAAARQILGHYGVLAGIGVMLRGLRVERVIPPPIARDLFYLAHLGVIPELSGQGIGGEIVSHLLANAAARGFRRAALDVSLANSRAQSLYERMGFSVLRQHKSRLSNRYASVPDHRRMEWRSFPQ